MLYKRSKKAGSPWWVRFTIRGREIRVTSGTTSKTLAEEFERRLREQIWRETELGEVQYSWEDAKERWLKEKEHKRSIARDRQAFAALDPYLSGKALCDIDANALAAVATALRNDPNARGGRRRSAGTANRILAVARSTLHASTKWGWLAHAPKVEAQHVEKHDPRFLTRAEFDRLASELPKHLARMARFAVATGLRWSNISGLRWAMVDLERSVAYIPSGETKTRKAIPVPLSTDARALLNQALRDAPGSTEYVFKDHLGRAPVGSPKTAWRKACKRAGLEGVRFHDLRHTWAAWHTIAGTPPIILKELGGWSSLAMVERYSALNPGHLSEWADNISRTQDGTRSSEK